MKKVLCVLLSLVLALSCAFVVTAAEEEKTLKFNEDGSFKIMQINDTQDVGDGGNEKMIKFIEAALDKEQPDLVVFVGDQLADFYPFATKEDMTKSIERILVPLEERGIPFLMTLGNHDHDKLDKLSVEEQYAVYASFESCYATGNGTDGFTYNVPVLSSDGEEIAFNIYMMNTHNKAESGGYAGVNADQVDWYKETAAALKAENGGEAVPSMLFQHIPPKEIYTFFAECSWNDEGAIYSRRDSKWYKLDENEAELITAIETYWTGWSDKVKKIYRLEITDLSDEELENQQQILLLELQKLDDTLQQTIDNVQDTCEKRVQAYDRALPKN